MGLPDQQAHALQQMIFGTRSRTPSAGGTVEECRVHHIDTHGVWFTRPMFDSNAKVFGPAPYTWPAPPGWSTGAAGTGPHTHTIPAAPNGPVAGDRLLVVWVATSTGHKPWAVGWWVL